MVEHLDVSVLFLCTHNSARSLIAETITNRNRIGVRAYSAGSSPRGRPHQLTLELLKSYGHPVKQLRSKSWQEFARPGAPRIDYVISVCDSAAQEACPHWPGQPLTANWSVPDPSTAPGGGVAKRTAFVRAYFQLEQRINAFLAGNFSPPHAAAQHERVECQGRLDLIGEMMWKPKDEELQWPEPTPLTGDRVLRRA